MQKTVTSVYLRRVGKRKRSSKLYPVPTGMGSVASLNSITKYTFQSLTFIPSHQELVFQFGNSYRMHIFLAVIVKDA